jgi:hypothetical protein
MGNISIIQDWLKGDNLRPPSINFVVDKINEEKKKREMNIGDTYTDDDGKTWRKTSYGWANIPKVLTAIKETACKCSACQKEIELNTRDSKFYAQTKMCFDCSIEMDTKRKLNGTFKNYEQYFIFKKQRDYVSNLIQELKHGIESLNEKETIEFINEFGDIEKWSGINVNKIKEDMEKDLIEGESILKNINEQLEKFNVQ